MRSHLHLLCLLALLLCGALTPAARSSIPPDCDRGYVGSHFPDAFVTIIDCRDGRETLTVSSYVPPDTAAGFVIALPARVEQVTATWRETPPIYAGRTPISKLHQRLDRIPRLSAYTQIYPFVLRDFFSQAHDYAAEIPTPSSDPAFHGLVCMIRAANSPAQLQDEITRSQIQLLPGEVERLSTYADGRHSFALIKIQSLDDYRKPRIVAGATIDPLSARLWDLPCIDLDFPSPAPVLPTYSVNNAEGSGIRQNTVVRGYVKLPPTIRGFLNPENAFEVRAFRGSCFRQIQIAPNVYDYAGPVAANIAYTRIEPHQYYGPPPEITFIPLTGREFDAVDQGYSFFEPDRILYAVAVAWIIVCSYLSGGVTGLIFARRWNRYAALGLWNLATIVALRLRLVKVPELRRKNLFTLAFSLIYLTLNHTASIILYHYLGPYSVRW